MNDRLDQCRTDAVQPCMMQNFLLVTTDEQWCRFPVNSRACHASKAVRPGLELRVRDTSSRLPALVSHHTIFVTELVNFCTLAAGRSQGGLQFLAWLLVKSRRCRRHGNGCRPCRPCRCRLPFYLPVLDRTIGMHNFFHAG